MKLPTKSEDSQKGQILIIFLLVLVVGLAIALSIASRSVTDVRQTTTSDESNRAYFAAEAGVEDALKKIEDKTVVIGTQQTLDLIQTNRSSADVTVTNLDIADGEIFEYPIVVRKDDVAQINLMPDFDNVATAGNFDAVRKGIIANDILDVYWGETGSQTAIEVSIITCLQCNTVSPEFKIHKLGFDPLSRISGFCTTITGPISDPGSQITNLSPSGVDYRYKASITLNNSVGCGNNDAALPAGESPVLARIRMLYEDAIVGIGGHNAIGTNHLPNQGYQVESLGKVGSGVARKLLVNRLYPALPSVFDYVLYNGSTSSPLQK